MKLRTFLSTVPMAAVALALPAKAEPRYVAVMDPCASPEPKSTFRGWEMDHDMTGRAVTFKTVERSENGDYMCATLMIIYSENNGYAESARLRYRCERWTCRLGRNPLYSV